MSANTAPIFPGTVKNAVETILPADSTNEKTLVTGGTNGSRVDAVAVSSTDTAAKVLNVIINNGTTSYVVGTVSIPIGAGTDAAVTPARKLLNSTDLPWLDPSGSLWLESGWKLNVAAQAAVTSNKVINIVTFYGDY